MSALSDAFWARGLMNSGAPAWQPNNGAPPFGAQTPAFGVTVGQPQQPQLPQMPQMPQAPQPSLAQTNPQVQPLPAPQAPMGYQFPGLINFDRPGQSNAYGNSNSLGGLSSMLGMPQGDPNQMLSVANGGQGLIDLLKGFQKPPAPQMSIGAPPPPPPTASSSGGGGSDIGSILGTLGALGIAFL